MAPQTFDLAKAIAPYVSMQTLATVLIVGAVYAARYSANEFIQHMKDGVAANKKELEIIRRRQSKLLSIMVECPSVAKENVSWLRDDAKNSKPPVRSLCERRLIKEREENDNRPCGG